MDEGLLMTIARLHYLTKYDIPTFFAISANQSVPSEGEHCVGDVVVFSSREALLLKMSKANSLKTNLPSSFSN